MLEFEPWQYLNHKRNNNVKKEKCQMPREIR